VTPTIDRTTGPQTEAGNQKSLLGFMRYTLGDEQVVVSPNEDRELYHSHLKTFQDEHQPQGATEEHLVQSLADLSWRLNRVVALETNILSLCYSTRGLVEALFDQAKALANLSLHSHRLSRQFKETLAHLRDLQKIRRAEEEQDMDKLLVIMEMYEDRGETYDPSADGFVFTEMQINQAIQARDRERLVDEAYESFESDDDSDYESD